MPVAIEHDPAILSGSAIGLSDSDYQLRISNPPISIERRIKLKALTRAIIALPLFCAAFSAQLFAQLPSIELKTSRGFIHSSGDDGLQPFVITLANPTDEDLRDVSFTVTMPAGVELGAVNSECSESIGGSFKTLSCEIDFVGPHNIVVLDFFVDGPLSSVPDGVITMELDSSITAIEQTEFEKSLADGDRTRIGSSLTLPLVRDILFDGNNNNIADINENLLQPAPTESIEQIQTAIAQLDVLFLVSEPAQEYLLGQQDQRIAQLLTSTNEVFRSNDIHIRVNSLGVDLVEFSTNEGLSETLGKMQQASDLAFADLQDRVRERGADMVVLLHALNPGTDEFCGFSSNAAIGRQGDFTAELHRGQLLTVLDVGPNCTDIPDLATSLATNMGVVPSRSAFPDGGTFSYSAGYGITDSFRTIATRVGGQDFGTAADVNRFSNPAFLCMSLSCGVDESDIALGANAALSLNETRHVVNAINDAGISTAIAEKRTVIPNNGFDLEVSHTTVEAGALVGAFTEFELAVSNNGPETLHDLNLTTIHLDNGFLDFSAGNYRVDGSLCSVSGATLTTTQTLVESLLQKQGRLNCYIDSIAPGETVNLNYFIEIDAQPPELNEGENYLHEIVAINGALQNESARCIPVYTDLLDATVASGVCNVVNQLAIATATGTGFLDLEALPTITGNIINVPWLRLSDGSMVAAQFQVVNFGVPELELLSYQNINAALAPVLESSFDEVTNVLNINGISLAEATYNLSFIRVLETEPVRFDRMVLELVETEEE